MRLLQKLFPMGTRSVLFGAHCFFIHPIFVWLAWWKLYGFPLDPRLYVAFFVHDLGYVGKKKMDDEDGERHVEFGAKVMHWLFDWIPYRVEWDGFPGVYCRNTTWHDFSLYHSRFYAKRAGVRPSKLCAADKLSVTLEPWWLYLPRVILSGEINEYMELAKQRTAAGEPKYAAMKLCSTDRRRWFEDMCEYLRRWAYTHRDGREDTWTPAMPKETAK